MSSKHALLILAHDNPAQLELLLKSLRHSRLDPFLHLDIKSTASFEGARHMAIKSLQRHNIQWGGYRMVQATLDLLRSAHSYGAYDTFTLLSGRDYPVVPTSEIVAWLDRVENSRIDHWHSEDPSWHSRWNRYFFHDWSWPWNRIANATSRRLATVLPDRSWPIKPYFGSQWWTLVQHDVRLIFDFIERRQDVIDFMKYVHIPDECFFQTILCNHPEATNLSRKKRRYIDWSEERAHPKILTEKDIPKVLDSDSFLARKLDIREFPKAVCRLEDRRNQKS
jgi:hypothetical protein